MQEILNFAPPPPPPAPALDAPDMTLLELFGPLPDHSLQVAATDSHADALACHSPRPRDDASTTAPPMPGPPCFSRAPFAAAVDAPPGMASPSSAGGSKRRRQRSESPPPREDEQTALKRHRNTMAARKYRQKRLDRIAYLERALGDVTGERDQLRLQLARREAEVEALREMLASKYKSQDRGGPFCS